MAAILSSPPTIPPFSPANPRFRLQLPRTHFPPLQRPIPINSKSFFSLHTPSHLVRPQTSVTTRAKPDEFIESFEKDESLPGPDEKPVKFLLWVLLWASVSIALYAFSKDAKAAAAASDSIRASAFGVRVADAMRASGWPDEFIVFALATLPVIELRGAIPVGYWLKLKPVKLTLLSILGNMVPVPFIILYIKKLSTLVAGKSKIASRLLDILFAGAKAKAGPVEEFRWLGLMLFVAVPFPGTGAWTGAVVASVLDMPFWSGVSANFLGVVLAGLLVNLLVNLGLRYAILVGVILLVASTFMWSVVRGLKNSFNTSK